MRKLFFRTVASLFICVLLSALLIGIYSDNLRVSHQSVFVTYCKTALNALLIILIYGYWLFYIPPILLFNLIALNPVFGAPHLKESNRNVFYIVLCALIGAVYALPILLLVKGPALGVAWYEVLSFGIVGAVYGILYRYWIAKEKAKP